MAAARPPKRVHLPSGRVFALEAKVAGPRKRAPKGPLFSELVELVASGELVLREGDAAVDVRSLALADFHALRAIATRLGWLAEEPIEIGCRNCEEPMRITPCASLELGPWADGELDDEDLDRRLPLTLPHPIPPVRLPGGATARHVSLRDVTVADAMPLHRALRRRRIAITDRLVGAMGLESLGPERDLRRIAGALERCSDAAWIAIGDLFLRAHYPPRLAAVAICPKCGARNDVDAPYEREFEPAPLEPQSNEELFPSFDAFSARAKEIFESVAGPRADHVTLIVDANVPACDDGGEPLLGGYVPPGGDPTAPVGVGEVTVYHRTFEAMWTEDGPYDWDAELAETIEHELEHHDGWLVGHDPMDDEERAEIVREHARMVGRAAAARRSVGALGADFRGFIARTWPIWLIVAVVSLAITVCNR
ncbi:MAG TPA: hypothetical protein VF765_24930 [Polyangiaceae bacterium]